MNKIFKLVNIVSKWMIEIVVLKCYNAYKVNIYYNCLSGIGFGLQAELKGKQVKFLYGPAAVTGRRFTTCH